MSTSKRPEAEASKPYPLSPKRLLQQARDGVLAFTRKSIKHIAKDSARGKKPLFLPLNSWVHFTALDSALPRPLTVELICRPFAGIAFRPFKLFVSLRFA